VLHCVPRLLRYTPGVYPLRYTPGVYTKRTPLGACLVKLWRLIFRFREFENPFIPIDKTEYTFYHLILDIQLVITFKKERRKCPMSLILILCLQLV
jgi:hypothetical protein